MASSSGKTKAFKNAIKAVLEELQFNGEQAFYVKDSSYEPFDATPGLRLLPGDFNNEKASTAEGERIINFTAYVALPQENLYETPAETYDQMYDLTDLLLDTIDKGDFLNSLSEKDPTLGTNLLGADRGDWYASETKAGAWLVCEVNIYVKYSLEWY